MSIKLFRGDTKRFKFQRIDGEGKTILVEPENVFFTVKKSASHKDFVFQKTINDMTFDSEGYFHFTINPSDTNGLMPKEYVYDIEVKDGNYIQTISFGEFVIIPDITTPNNEV